MSMASQAKDFQCPPGAPRPVWLHWKMAGLLTRGSGKTSLPGLCPASLADTQWRVGFATHIQLRGQSRIWCLLATPHRVPF